MESPVPKIDQFFAFHARTCGEDPVLIAGPGIWIGNSHDNTVIHNEVFDTYNTGIEVCMPSQSMDPGDY